MYNLKDYTDKVEVFDWEENKKIVIPMNKDLSIKENSQKYYALYTKSKSAKEKLEGLKINAIEEISYLEQILYSIEGAQDLKTLFEMLKVGETPNYLKDIF